MDQYTQAQSNIHGNYSGNRGNNNVIGNNNTISNTYVLHNTADSGVGDQGRGIGAGDAARPYRLIPYGRNSGFTGRKNLVESVKRFSENKGHNRVALYGLGGSGKTQIALECVYRLASETNRDIFWVQGSGILKFSESLGTVAQNARIHVASTGSDNEEFLLGVRRWFEGPSSGDWILVIDNADNEDDFIASNSPIAKFIPHGTKGTLIFTTRSRQVASRQGCKMIEVAEMGSEEALELFSKRFGTWDTLEDGEKKATAMILASVHHLPLAVVGLAAFMIETATPPSDYWTIFQEKEERTRKLLSQEFSDIQREADMTESILGTYFLTFDRIRQQMPRAAHLLWLMAFFDRQNIPEELLSQCGLEGMDDSVEFRRAIGKLLGFSLVTIAKRENKTFYELHRLVQLSLQVYLPTEDLSQWRATALQVVSRCFPQDEHERRSIGPAYIPHALAVTKDATDPIAEELFFRMGRYFLDMGSYSNAETQFQRCIEFREEGKECDWDREGLIRFRFLGEAKLRQGKYDESEEMDRRAMEQSEKLLGPDHLDTLASVNNLAVVLSDRGKYEESETMYRHALQGYEKALGPDHPDTLSCVDNLATVLHEQGRYSESETMNRRALEGYEKVLGPDHRDTLSSVGNLAVVLREQGRHAESETMNRRALEGYEKVLGPDHPDTLSSVNNLARVLHEQGRYTESETMYRRAVEGCEEVLGLHHPITLSCVNNLAAVLQEQGRYGESETMNRRALEGREKLLGHDHPDTLSSVNNLARVLHEQGRYNESETMHRRAMEGFKEVLGPEHPSTLSCVNNLAMVLFQQGRYNESETMYRRALEGFEQVLGPDHPLTRNSAAGLAVVLDKQVTSDESEPTTLPTQSSPPMELDRTGRRSTGRRVRRFLKAVVLGRDVGQTK